MQIIMTSKMDLNRNCLNHHIIWYTQRTVLILFKINNHGLNEYYVHIEKINCLNTLVEFI